MSAPPLRGSFVINIGELMKRWTNGRFKATVHRVVHLQNKSRYSMPLFCNPNFRTIVDPRDLGIADAEALYPPIQSGEFLLQRFKATRKLWGAERIADGAIEARRNRPPAKSQRQHLTGRGAVW
jgi:isopenicillin N synthase-like dioxygenase